MNVVSVLDQHSRNRPDSPAVVGDHEVLTYGDLRRLTSRFASHLRGKGIGPGDRVSIVLGNGLPFVVGYLGSIRLGALPVPLNIRLRAVDLAQCLRDVGAAALLCPRELAPQFPEAGPLIEAEPLLHDLATLDLDEDVPAAPSQWGDVANLVFTSGSTSRAKAVMQTHGMHIATGAALAEHFRLSCADTGALVSPLFHIAGLTMLSAALHVGGPFAISSSSKPDHVLRVLERHDVAYIHLVGTVLGDIIRSEMREPSGCTLAALRQVMFGGAAIASEELRWFEERFGCRITSAYGRTEGGKTWCEPESGQRFTAHGLLNRNVCEVRIVDPRSGQEAPTGIPGEIRVRGDGVSAGYWAAPELTVGAFDAEGWMRTGDQGLVDQHGYLHFLGRSDGMIKSGGENVYPQEVERAIAQIPGVREVVVVGVPHPRLGQTVGALLVGSPHLDELQVQAAARRDLAGFKIPRVIRVVDRLPRLGSNKYDMPAVKSLLAEHPAIDSREVTERR